MHAVVVDAGDQYISDADTSAVLWSWTSGTFVGQVSPTTGNHNKAMTLTPTSIATATFTATYDGSDASITTKTFTSAAITATSVGTPATMTISSGDFQSAIVGSTIQPLSVLVVDTNSVPVANQAVAFTVLSGGGSVTASVNTNASGIASATAVLGNTAGLNQFTATVTGYGSVNKTFSATGTPGTPSVIVFTTTPVCSDYTVACGTQPSLVINDSHGNAALVSGTVTIATTPPLTYGSGTFSGLLSASVVSGSATFSGVKYSTHENGVRLTASFTYGGSTITADSASFNVLVGAQTLKILSGLSGSTALPTSATSYAAMNMHAALFDASNVYQGDVSDGAVLWTWSSSSFSAGEVVPATGTQSNTLVLTPTSINTATFTATYAGSDASISKTPFTSAAITSTATTPTTLVFTTQPVCADYTVACGTQPSVVIRDASSNTALISGTVTISASPVTGTGTFGGSLSATVTNGVATFSGLTYSKFESSALTGVQAKLTATLDGTPAVTANSASFDVGTGNRKIKILSGASGNTAALTATLSITGTTTNGSTSLTSVSSIAGVVAGMGISGSNIPAYAVVSSASGSTIVMSAAATATASGTSVTLNRTNATVASPYSMHAVFVDANDNYISNADSSVLWTWTGSTFAGADVSPATGVRSMAMTLTPSSIATAKETCTAP